MEHDITQPLLDISEKIGEIKGTQTTMIWVISGVGAVGVIVIGYLGHCVYSLGTKMAEISTIINSIN